MASGSFDLLKLLGAGAARKAGKTIRKRQSQVDAAIARALGKKKKKKK